MMNESLAHQQNLGTLLKFIWLVEEAKFYITASTFLSDSFSFTSDQFVAKNKDEWLAHFPDNRHQLPEFGQVMIGQHSNQVFRAGTLRTANSGPVAVTQVIEFNADGKIKSISIEKLELVHIATSRKTKLLATFRQRSRSWRISQRFIPTKKE